MFELGTLFTEHVNLCQRAVEQRLLLSDVEARRRTQIVARSCKVERASLQIDGAGEHVKLNIGCAQVEIGGRKIGRQQ